MINKQARTRVPIHELLAARWSARAIDQNRKVQRHDIVALLEAARWAPSCYGDQPWRYILLDRFENAAAWNKGFNCLSDGNQAWIRRTPLLIVALADSIFERNGKPNRWAQYDTGAASENLCLQATALGLVAHQMGGFRGEELRTAFHVPERFTPMAVIGIGHPGDPQELPEDKRASHYAERRRKPLHEIAFEGEWQNAVEFEL